MHCPDVTLLSDNKVFCRFIFFKRCINVLYDHTLHKLSIERAVFLIAILVCVNTVNGERFELQFGVDVIPIVPLSGTLTSGHTRGRFPAISALQMK